MLRHTIIAIVSTNGEARGFEELVGAKTVFLNSLSIRLEPEWNRNKGKKVTPEPKINNFFSGTLHET